MNRAQRRYEARRDRLRRNAVLAERREVLEKKAIRKARKAARAADLPMWIREGR